MSDSPGSAAVPAARENAAGTAALPGKTRRPLRLIWIVGMGVVGFAVWLAFFHDRGPADDLGKLQGDWNYSVAARANAGVIRVEGNTWTYHSGGPFGKSYRITLRSEANPKEIDLALLGDDGQPVAFTHGAGKGTEVKMMGIYSINDNEVKLALGVTSRPITFDDDEAQLLVLTK